MTTYEAYASLVTLDTKQSCHVSQKINRTITTIQQIIKWYFECNLRTIMVLFIFRYNNCYSMNYGVYL